MWKALLGMLAVMTFPAPSQPAIPFAWQSKALALSEHVWHPACGRLTITYRDPDKTGVVVVDDTTGRVVHRAAGFTAKGSCALGISTAYDWRSLGYPVYCSVVLHEAGRAAGAVGTTGPGVMHVGVSFVSHGVSHFWRRGRWHRRVIWSGVDRRCIRPVDLR
jgi:hypothetical protein